VKQPDPHLPESSGKVISHQNAQQKHSTFHSKLSQGKEEETAKQHLFRQ
jgi:hypothetical protein